MRIKPIEDRTNPYGASRKVPADATAKIVCFGVFCLIVVAILLSSFAIINPDERGIRVTLGKIQGDVMESGFNWKLPFVTRIQTYKVSTQKVQVKLDVFSKDMQSIIITSDIIFNYTPDKAKLLASKYTQDPVRNVLLPIAQECFKEICKDLNSEEIVKNRDIIREKVNKLYGERLAVHEVFTIANVVVSDIELSKQLNDAIEKKMVQDQEAQRASFVQKQKQTEAETAKIEAMGLANAVREAAKAKADAALLEAEAKAKGISLVAEAESEAIRKKGNALKESPEALKEITVKTWDGKLPHLWTQGQLPFGIMTDAKN